MPIEDRMKNALPQLVNNCMLVGDKRKFLAILVTLKTEINLDTLEPTNRLLPGAVEYLQSNGVLEVRTVEELLHSEGARARLDALLTGALEKVNAQAVSRAQEVHKHLILQQDFSIPNGELGPTLKLRRTVVEKKYKHLIDQLYLDANANGIA